MMERAKQIAVTWLQREWGFAVESIETTDNRRADLRANDGQSEYTFEVKDKIDIGNHSGFSELPVRRGTVAIRSDVHKRLDRLDNILRDGHKQIAETPGTDNLFNVIWMNFDGPSADMLGRRLLYTFYGIADLCPRFSDGGGVNCLYFDFNTAYRMTNVHALIVCENLECQIAINEFASNVDKFRETLLVQKFGNAKYDPAEYEADETKIVLRSDISRKNEQEVLNEVKRQTGIDYYRIEMNRYTFGPGKLNSR